MQKHSKLALVALVVCITTTVTGYAYADTNSDATIAGLNGGAAIKAGGFGALSGVLLSIFTVWNKNQTAPGTERIDPKKLGINLVLGAVIGIALSSIGINVNSPAISQAMQTIIPTAVSYMFLHFTNLALRPMFGKWVKGGSNGSGSASKSPGQSGTPEKV